MTDAPPDEEPAAVNESNEAPENRDNWSSRAVFWLAAVGSAVGLGNLWRFPWQCATWGGGPFLLAYIICLLTIGMPVMTQELTLGQKHRSGDIEAFGKMHPRLRGIGLASVIGAFGIVTYYMVIIGLSLVLFFDSFRKDLPYGEKNQTYAYDDVWLLRSSIEDTRGAIGGRLFVCTTVSWLITFICINRGVKSASWAVKITMPLPILLLIVLLIKGLLLDGAANGITEQYLNFENWDKLNDVELWGAAIGQCFFSLSVCMGVMTAYASYNPETQNIATDEKVITLADLGVSLLSGFVVYSVLGYLVKEKNDESYYEQKSFGLAFVVYPLAIDLFGKGKQVFGVIFFLILFLLGIDSAFSMVEAVTTVIYDSEVNKYRLGNMTRTKISAIICFIGAFISAVYCWDTGLYWLDIIDRYINNYGMVLLGIAETGACGWFYRVDVQVDKVGQTSITIYRYGYFLAVFIGVVLGFSLCTADKNPADGTYSFTPMLDGNGWLITFFICLIIFLGSIILGYTKRKDPNMSFGATMWYLIGWHNVEVLRNYINSITDPNWESQALTCAGEVRAAYHHGLIGIWWGFYIKYFIPTMLTLVLVGVFRADSWNGYEGFPRGALAVGALIFSAMVIVMFVVAVKPTLMMRKDDDWDWENGRYKSQYEEQKKKTEMVNQNKQDNNNNNNTEGDNENQTSTKEDGAKETDKLKSDDNNDNKTSNYED